MDRGSGLQSLFSQKLDRGLFGAYFLGAVVPLLGFGYMVQRYALPAEQGDDLASTLVVGTTIGVSLLSLAAFFALRRISLGAVARIDADKDRLAAILAVSRELAFAPHVHAAAGLTVGCAHRLVPDACVLLLRRPGPGKAFELCESAGQGAQHAIGELWEELTELVEAAVRSNQKTPRQPLGAGVALAMPLSVDDGTAGALVVIADAGSRAAHVLAEPSLLDALETLAGIAAVAIHGSELKDSQRNFFTHATEIMVMALDARDAGHTGGCHGVAQLANLIGREIGLDDEALRRMHFASLLADIGTLKLNAAQQRSAQHYARHPQLGHRILSRIRLWEPLAEIVLHHHDAWDGSGESGGLRGDAIPLESRIIHVADTWKLLEREHASRTPLTPAGVLSELESESGTRFDPGVLEAVRRLADRGALEVA
jgi:HD-GYP domain-containing protein (c-di-GMP phosphodiesterase class II)